MSRAIAIVATAVLVLVVSPAAAQRGRAASGRARQAQTSAMPKRIGQGWFSRVYRSRDGKFVIKKLLPAIAGIRPQSPRRRAEMAKITVEASELFRREGLPVPRTYHPEGRKGLVVQEYVSGLTFDQLQGKAKFKASSNRMALFAKAKRIQDKHSNNKWYYDPATANLLFNKDGTIKSWIDPIVPTTRNVVLSVHRAIEKQKKQAESAK